MPNILRFLWVASLAGSLLWPALGNSAESRGKVLLNPQFDPTAERIELFSGIEAGLIDARMRPQNAEKGAVFIENLSDRPLTVELPPAVVGVQVLPQFDGLFQASNGNQSGRNGGQGANQPVGGGFSSGVSGNGSTPNLNFTIPVNAPPGQGFFSIPPERIARIEYRSVCLEHGAVDPKRGNTYRLVRVEDFSTDPRLPELLKLVASQNDTQPALQAAAWHIANGMSWSDLQAKQFNRLAAPDEPYFRTDDLKSARTIVSRIDEVLLAGYEAAPLDQSNPATKLSRSQGQGGRTLHP